MKPLQDVNVAATTVDDLTRFNKIAIQATDNFIPLMYGLLGERGPYM